MMKCGIVQEF